MPFPDTVYNLLLLNFKFTYILKKTYNHNRQSQIKVWVCKGLLDSEIQHDFMEMK